MSDLHDDPDQPFDPLSYGRGMEGSRIAARRWTEAEKDLLRRAVVGVARIKAEFTADDIWYVLPEGFPVTKGLAGVLNGIAHDGVIESTGRVRFAQRGGAHDHRQRLAVWRSLIVRADAQTV